MNKDAFLQYIAAGAIMLACRREVEGVSNRPAAILQPNTPVPLVFCLPCQGQNANYNVLGVASRTGRLVERYEYTPYGQRTVYSHGWLSADVDDDGDVDDDDRDIMAGNYRLSPATLDEGDVNGSGHVSQTDVIAIFLLMGESVAFDDDPLVMYPAFESYRHGMNPYGLSDFGHQGLMHDKEFGLINNRARYLDPPLGRFISADPGPGRHSSRVGTRGYKGQYKDGMNLYQYVKGNPTNRRDPMGMEIPGGVPGYPGYNEIIDSFTPDPSTPSTPSVPFGTCNKDEERINAGEMVDIPGKNTSGYWSEITASVAFKHWVEGSGEDIYFDTGGPFVKSIHIQTSRGIDMAIDNIIRKWQNKAKNVAKKYPNQDEVTFTLKNLIVGGKPVIDAYHVMSPRGANWYGGAVGGYTIDIPTSTCKMTRNKNKSCCYRYICSLDIKASNNYRWQTDYEKKYTAIAAWILADSKKTPKNYMMYWSYRLNSKVEGIVKLK